MIGQRFGKLVVRRQVENGRKSNARYECLCDCGTLRVVYKTNLVNGRTLSCGCYHKQKAAEDHTTHGKSHLAEYQVWGQMIARCTDPSNAGFRLYGGRGITVCDRWMELDNFIADMGLRPSPKHSIDRIDNQGPYCKENCRWATTFEQAQNTSRNRMLTFNGQTKCLTQWARELGISPNTLTFRLLKTGLSVEQALTTPINLAMSR